MRVAVVGSRSLTVENLAMYLPPDMSEIVSGGAKGIDRQAKEYALQHHIQYTEFLPDYARYGRSAPLKRNDEIIRHAELVLIFWDGSSRGSAYVIQRCEEWAVAHQVIRL